MNGEKNTDFGQQIQLNADGTLGISCKVPGEWYPLLKMICELRGTNINNLLKMCLQFLIETARVSTEPSPDMKVLMHMMRVDANWQKMFNYLTNSELDIAQVILVLQQRQDGKPREGFALAMFDKPFMGDCRQTLSVDEIIERVIEVAMGKDDYWDLRKVAKHFDAESIREALVRMVDAQTIINLDEADRDELPGMGTVATNGREVIYGAKTKGKQHITADSMANDKRYQQQTISFDEYDTEIADEEASNG